MSAGDIGRSFGVGQRVGVLARVGAIAIAIGAAPAARAQTGLMEVYRLAVDGDAVYQAATAANRAAQEGVPQARASLLPNVDLSLSATANRLDVRNASNAGTTTGTRDFSSEQISLNLSQPIYRKDLWIALDQADQRVRRANAEYAFARQELMLRVAQRYFDVLSARDELNFAGAAREAFGQQLKQSQQRFEVGLIAITDVEEAKAGYDLATAEVIAAENQLDNAREALREVTGQYHGNLRGLGDSMPLASPEPDDIEAWTQTALEQNLQLAAAHSDTETARDEIKRVESGHLPSLDLVGAHTRSDSGGGVSGGTESWQSSLALQLSVPVYQGGLVVSRTRESRHLYRQSLDQLEVQRRSTHRQTRDAYLGVKSGISRVKALEQALRSTESARAAIEAGFQVGTRTSVDVLNADRDLFRTRRDLAVARYGYILDVLQLKVAAGTLSEEDIERVNGWLR